MDSMHPALQELYESTQRIMRIMDGTSFVVFNKRPDEHWSMADCLEHLIQLEQLILVVLNGEVRELDGRDPGQKIQNIKVVFANIEQKLSAGGPTIPSKDVKNRLEITEKFIITRDKITNYLVSADTSKLCMGFKHRLFGELTRLEWLYFIIYHSNRHAIQMENIFSEIY